MPICCIVQCGNNKNKNQPQLTLHRFPRNEVFKKMWLDAIGIKNINPRQKDWFVCSLHFEESCFNRTLDVTRLRENTIPTISLPENKKHSGLCDRSNRQGLSTPAMPILECNNILQTAREEQRSDYEMSVLCNEKNTPEPSTSTTPPMQPNNQYLAMVQGGAVINEKTAKLVQKCNQQKLKIKRLNEKVRKRNKKIADLQNIIGDLKKKIQINSE